MRKTLAVLVMPIIMTLNLRAASSPDQRAGDSFMPSTCVPLDSLVYRAIEQLAAEGYVQTALLGLRAWTRLDCARLIEEAEDQITDEPVRSDKSEQPFPLIYPTESVWLSGFFLRCVPRLPRLTVRAEGLSSPHRDLAFPGFFYFNVHYLSGYTSNRQLIGGWIGREAQGEQAWSPWHFSPRSRLELSGRTQTVNREFLEGGDLRDLRPSADIALHPEWQLRIEELTEWWYFPFLSTTTQRNAVFTIQLAYRPLERTEQ